MKQRVLFLPMILILFAFACNLGNNEPSTNMEAIATQAAQTITAGAQTALVGSPTTTIPSLATSSATTPQATSQAGITNTPVCNQASFVSDVTIPDNTNITVNTGFTKTWRLRNVGSCTWTSGYQVIFDSGDQMNAAASQQLTNGTVLPGATVDVSINFTAPASVGTYKSNWKLKDANGTIFALSTGPFWVQIKAVNQQQPQADWPTYKIGDAGAEVFALQYLLKAHGYNLNADGVFGPITQTQVENFQTDNNLSEDAIVGQETWQKLIIQIAQGKTGPEVRAVQYLLKNKFGYNIAVDGIFGPDTANAVKDFQSDKGLAVDGIVGPQTWRNLLTAK